MHALFVTYGLAHDKSAAEHAELREQLAPALTAVPGLTSTTWLANDDTGCYGGFYVFDSRSLFDRFVASELYGALHSRPALHELVARDFRIDTPAPAPTLLLTETEASR